MDEVQRGRVFVCSERSAEGDSCGSGCRGGGGEEARARAREACCPAREGLSRPSSRLARSRKRVCSLPLFPSLSLSFFFFFSHSCVFFLFLFFCFHRAAIDEAELAAELARVEEEDRAAGAGAAAPPSLAPGKPHVNVVFIGHVDHGKSTMSGAILLASNMVDKREIQKLQSDAEAEGRESWWKAFLMDTNPEERAKVGKKPLQKERKKTQKKKKKERKRKKRNSGFHLCVFFVRARPKKLLDRTLRPTQSSTRFWTLLDTRRLFRV